MSIARYLKELGLGEYAAVFEKEAVDFETLPDLEDDDLRTLGLPLGHRKKLLRAISFGQPSTVEMDVAPEHRRVSVLFCDLVGSTQLSQGMSAEELRDLLAAFQEASVKEIEACGGHIAKYLGDGLMAYFGYPRAYEDDALRAVEAALEVMEGIHGVETHDGKALQARIGIHTGLVVAGEMGAGHTREKLSVVGEAPIISSRLEQLAEADEILISGAVQRLVDGYVSSDFRGAHTLKGVSNPVQVFRVRGRTEARSRIEANRGRGLAKIIGRNEELALLRSRWDRVRQGDGQVFLLSGEPGIGKSRIVTHLHDQLLDGGCASVIVQCSAQHTSSALYPFIDALDKAAGVFVRDDHEKRHKKILFYVTPVIGSHAANRLLDYLSVPKETSLNMDATQMRRGVMGALTDWLCGQGADDASCVIVEDAHWSDPSSLELLGQLVARSRELPILVVVTTRPGFYADWATQHNATTLSLNRLGRSSSRLIVDAQLAGFHRTADQAFAIVERAEGVPLFLEELSRVARDMSHGTRSTAIPATLDGSLSTRLGGLGGAKRFAQVGSVLGRQFPEFILAKVLDLDDIDFQHQLSKLVEADILARQGAPDSIEYSFTHALVQDAAYASLLKRDRLRLHGEVADVLLELPEARRFPDEMIARHLAEAGRFNEAARLWLLAGRAAQRRSADREAIEHFREGLRALKALPPSHLRDRRELEVVMALAPLVLVVKGWSAVETSEIYSRARALSQVLNERMAMLPILYGEYLIHISRAEYASALILARELLALAEESKDEAGRLQGHRVIAWCSLYMGRLSESEAHAAKLLELYQSDRHSGVALEYGYDPRVAGQSILAIVCALRGDEDASIQFGREAVEHARSIDHASSLAYALMFACAMPAAMRLSTSEANGFALELKSLAEDQESALWNAYADVIFGWSGDVGTEGIRSAIERLSVSARNPWQPFFQALCADLCLRTGQPEEARDLLEEAIWSIERTKERNWESEIYRLMGHAVRECSGAAENAARVWITKSIDTAARDGALALGKRAQRDLSEFANHYPNR